MFLGSLRIAVGLLGFLKIAKTSGMLSDYRFSPLWVKGIVQGLTSMASVFVSSGGSIGSESTTSLSSSQSGFSADRILEGLRADFREGYLFTGAIDTIIYDPQCSFTDPTISFTGLQTFEKNIKSIQPLIRRFIGSNIVVLKSIDKFPSLRSKDGDGDDGSIKLTASWRMLGVVRLPWNPVIDLCGQTEYTLHRTSVSEAAATEEHPYQRPRSSSGESNDHERPFQLQVNGDQEGEQSAASLMSDEVADSVDFLISRYYERWEMSATDALLQLLRPAHSKTQMVNRITAQAGQQPSFLYNRGGGKSHAPSSKVQQLQRDAPPSVSVIMDEVKADLQSAKKDLVDLDRNYTGKERLLDKSAMISNLSRKIEITVSLLRGLDLIIVP